MHPALTTLILLALLTAPSLVAADDNIEVVEVIAHPLSGEGLSQAAEVLDGEELLRAAQGTIGATLANQPGIHASSFGQASSRPIVHGLGGARVRVMEDRIDALDASVTSPDHAVTVDAFMADRIEVLKGPASLLYGSGAIGGVVDVHTGRIPHRVPPRPLQGRVELRAADNADRLNGALRLDGGAGAVAWHLDAFAREADPYTIPGFAAAERVRGMEHGDAVDEPFGVVPGSQFESAGAALGGSYLFGRGFVGLALARIESEYGLPGGHAEDEDGTPLLEMEQTRLDLEAAMADPFAVFDNVNFRVGINDYEHREIEPEGEIATTVTNEAFEVRVEASHGEGADWRGTMGLQLGGREFSALGEEAFVPPVESSSVGLFWVGERGFERFDLETGARLEFAEHDPAVGRSRNFTAYGVSLGLVAPFENGWQLGVHGDYSARAPVAEELYSDGPHLATRTFERGDAGLGVERAFNLSATLQYSDAAFEWMTTLYRTAFDDFIYGQFTGAMSEGLPVAAFTQRDATFAGLDMEAAVTVAAWTGGRARVRGLFDAVVAALEVDGNDNLPRIPPTRFGAGLALEFGRTSAALDYTYVSAVHTSDTAPLELPTSSYNDLRLHLGTTMAFGAGSLEIFLAGRNLTDDEQRAHTSFIKDFVPLPGRTIEAGLRLTF